MFIDSAQLRESMLSHAKALNYVPRSFRSAVATINLQITPTSNTTTTVNVPARTEFISRVGSNTYVFSNVEDLTLTSSNGTFIVNNLAIYEGLMVQDTFIMDTSNTSQRFVLSNPNIDTRSLRVLVSENSAANIYRYEVRSSLFDVSANTAMCFLQPADKDRYEIVFGNGIAGRPPSDGALIITQYQVSSGQLPNGASLFSSTGAIDGHSNVKVTTVTSAVDGDIHESIESIRFNAPRFYQTQERAITANDYRVMLQVAFPEITAINVFGGEDADPPRYGTVVIAASLAGSSFMPENKKQEYTSYIKRRASLSTDPVFVEPSYLDIDLDADIRYNTGSTVKTSFDIETLIRNAIADYSSTYLNNFAVTLRYSSLVKAIDAADSSIISNDLYVKPFVSFVPSLGVTQSHTLKFYNEFRRLPYSDRVHIYEDEHTIRSTPFVYEGALCTIEDDGLGHLRLVQVSGKNHLVAAENIGTVDYTNGVVSIVNLKVSSYEGSKIKVYAVPLSRDIIASKNQILRINDIDVNVNILAERIL